MSSTTGSLSRTLEHGIGFWKVRLLLPPHLYFGNTLQQWQVQQNSRSLKPNAKVIGPNTLSRCPHAVCIYCSESKLSIFWKSGVFTITSCVTSVNLPRQTHPEWWTSVTFHSISCRPWVPVVRLQLPRQKDAFAILGAIMGRRGGAVT